MPSYDAWFWWEQIDERTFAIREPEYWQQNINYLLLGEERALLFDSGPGKRDIRPVVRHLTKLPVMVTCSHTHWDHIGNHARFARVVMPDLPVHRACMRRGRYRTSFRMSLAVPPKRFAVTDWWKPGTALDLGKRTLELLHVPGHSPDSVALYDSDRRSLFMGDFVYAGQLIACTPGADIQAYRASAERVLTDYSAATHIYCAHGAMRIDFGAMRALVDAFAAIARGGAPFTTGRFLLWPTRQYFFPGFSIVTSATKGEPGRAG